MEKLTIRCTEKWFEQLPDVKFGRELQSYDLISSLKAEAQNLWDSECRLYNHLKENKRDKDFIWIKKILQTGTLSDKVSAHTLLIQDCAVYNVKSIETLIAMVNTKGKRECLMALDALQDLFSNVLLIENRKLRPFSEQPLKHLDSITKGSPVLRKRVLILWLFEDMLKTLYKNFLNNLDSVSHDTVEKTKQKAVTVMYNLLQENPEGEQFLLEHLVNKVGDPVAKIGSHVCFLLGQLLIHHPNMKAIVIQEVERLIFRPNLAERAKYYSLCFLNQVILSHEESDLANHLIMIYFSQFKLFVKKGEVNTKMMSALLTGIARAYPFGNLKDNVIMDRLDAMYRLVHMVSFNISIQALMLIFQVLDSKDSVSDRFYNVLYRKLLDPALSSSSRQAALLNLLYRAMKKDVAVVRVRAFVKRLLQIALYQAPNLQCGILMLISEINKVHPNILETVPSFQSDSDSDEYYVDLSDEAVANPGTEGEQDKIIPDVKPNLGSWVHRKQRTKNKSSKSAYDLDCRNPLHAKAEYAHLWELLFLKETFHPSVSLFAHQICNSNEIKYNGDPLIDFTVSRFLDRFVYRNPKKLSDSQLNTHTKVFGSRKLKAKSSKLLPVNSEEYLQQNEGKVPAEEKFIYQYLQKRSASGKASKHDSDIESVCSEDFQNLLDDMHAEDEGKNSLNFAKELGLHKEKKSYKRKADSDSDSINSLANDSDFEDQSEPDIEFEDEEFKKSFADLEEDMDDAEFCEEDFVDQGGPMNKRAKKKKRNDKSLTDGKLLACADEFSALLEDNVGNKVDTLSGEALRNQDKSGAKQLAWEIERDRYVRGAKWQNKKKFVKKKKFKK